MQWSLQALLISFWIFDSICFFVDGRHLEMGANVFKEIVVKAVLYPKKRILFTYLPFPSSLSSHLGRELWRRSSVHWREMVSLQRTAHQDRTCSGSFGIARVILLLHKEILPVVCWSQGVGGDTRFSTDFLLSLENLEGNCTPYQPLKDEKEWLKKNANPGAWVRYSVDLGCMPCVISEYLA